MAHTTRSGIALTCGSFVTLAALSIASPVDAQEVDANGRTVYAVGFFAGFAPSSALDIVERIPGFSLQDTDEDVRGFGQAAGNLVINGSRPSAKSDSLQTILGRIPASRVLRVEIGPGDLFGAEFSGKNQVVNLVLADGGGVAGTVTIRTSVDHDGRLTPEASGSALIRRGPSTFNVAIGYDNERQLEEGSDTITAFPSGRLIEYRRKVNDIEEREAYLTGSWELAGDETSGAHANFRLARGWFDLDQSNDVFPSVGAVRDDLLFQNRRRTLFELGGDVTRPLAGGGLKLIGLITRQRITNEDDVALRVRSALVGGFTQAIVYQREESVLRAVWSRRDVAGWSVEAGVEGALNQLDSDVTFEEIGQNGGRTRIDLPIDQAVVTEHRGEVFANAGRSLGDRMRLDVGLTYEASRLTVRGDVRSERSLSFLKPKASLDWRPATGWHLQLAATRTVAQLNFEDFISFAELTNERVNGGNADLLPQRAWELRGSVERTVWGDGKLRLEGGYQHISLLQDRVPTPEGFDAPGNLGSGTLLFVKAVADLPLAPVGINGGRLTVNGTLQDSSVIDPYTREARPFSGYGSWNLNVEFRQDLGKFAWGLAYYAQPAGTFFRRNEEDRFNGREPYLVAFAEWRPTRQTTLSLSLDNLADVPATRTRTFFAPDRSTLVPTAIEFRERNKHVTATLTLRHNFG
ncbi:TonB-dependent receptor [Sphingomonas lacunae]|uniref:TonB-dependent receptor n=1 Tax=Sphingomonas lacunae TaxID=2698828 RepID=A0A6M4AWI3_9SPHN|nr:TonB-dependent receptor [Sphingomonas lacunae]QJQ32672.1 TonB-dependent receptor [Sphingomonas lacunae]